MLNNPNIQPNTTINCWITGILLFNFTLKHIPGTTHGPDGLSRWPAQLDDEPNPPDDFEDWIDKSYGFMHMINPRSVRHGTGRALSLYILASTYNQQSSPPPSTIHSAAEPEPVHIFSNEATTTLDFTPLPIDTDTIFIPRTSEAKATDHHLNLIVHVLQSASRPEQVIESEWRRFISYALCFFIHADNLWCKNAHGEHKIVILPGCCLKLLTQAHDEVGHRGTYAT